MLHHYCNFEIFFCKSHHKVCYYILSNTNKPFQNYIFNEYAACLIQCKCPLVEQHWSDPRL